MFWVKYCIRNAQNILYISQIPNFNREYSNMSLYKTLKKNWIRHFLPIGVFTSLGVAIFRVTLCSRALIFVKKATICENDVAQFVFIFSTRIKCEGRKEYDVYFMRRLLQCNLNKAKIKYLEEWSDKCLCWQLISILLLLMINKSGS